MAGNDRVEALALAMELEPFPAALADAFLQRAQQTRIRKGQMVVGEGTEATDVYLIQAGRVQFSLVSIHGRELILRDFGPGHFFGELAAIDGLPRSASAIALDDCKLARMSGPAFIDFLGEVPRAGLWMAQQLARRVRDLTNRTFELATLPVAARLQTELLRLALSGERLESDRAVIRQLPTHADLAARIGTRREAVSRELSILSHEGLARQTGRSLEIPSIEKLKQQLDRLSR